MKVYTTTNGNYSVTDNSGKEHKFDAAFNVYSDSPDNFGDLSSSALRSDSKVFKALSDKVETLNKTIENLIYIDKILGFDIYADKSTFEMMMNFKGEFLPLTKENLSKIKAADVELKEIKVSKLDTELYKLGNRVLLIGPTGTGKTYEFLSTAKDMVSKGELDSYEIVSVSEGMEDVEFFNHVGPSETGGIIYKENNIVKLLKEAATGKKVAILFDELNRGSRAFLNIVLKLLDAVDGENYRIHNFIQDETYIIPIKNIMFVATMNFGGKYVATNVLDEALLDRFNVVLEKGYNQEVEESIAENFGDYKDKVLQLVENVRSMFSAAEIRSTISTRGIKMWAEAFIKTTKTEQDLFNTFNVVLMHRLVDYNDIGLANQSHVLALTSQFQEVGIL